MRTRIIRSVTALLLTCVGAVSAVAQNIRVTGKVTDAVSGEPLAGVTVMVEGTTTGEMTLSDGTYEIVASADAVLLYSMLGYKD